MIFSGDLPAKGLGGSKTVTRRMPSDNLRSPWWREKCAYEVGGDYAVVPGRGKHQVGRIRIIDVQLLPLGRLTIAEARREGFPSPNKFVERWLELHGSYRPEQLVWRVEFFELCTPSPRAGHTTAGPGVGEGADPDNGRAHMEATIQPRQKT